MSAVISDCGTYRYTLQRSLDQPGFDVCVIMVNPSTADAEYDDATIRKLKGFGRPLQWSRFTVVNKFAFRATDVSELRSVPDPIGPMNDAHIVEAMIRANIIVVAWGSLNKLPNPLRHRWHFITDIAKALDKSLYCLGICEDGHPKHPLMLSYSTPLVQWRSPR